MSFGRNTMPFLTPDHSPSSDQSTPRQFGFGWSQQSQSPVHTEASMNAALCYGADLPRDGSYAEPEQPRYSELYERLIAEARHRSFHNKNDDPSTSTRSQCGSGVGSCAVSPLSSNAYLGDPEGHHDSGCPAEEIYEYDGDAILQHYSDLSSLHSNEGYTDARSYAQPVNHSIDLDVQFTSSPYTTVPLLYQGLTRGGSCGPDENPEHIEQDSAMRYSQPPPAYQQTYTETPSDHTHCDMDYTSPAPMDTYDITQSQHPPVPNSRHSSYSELSANVAYILGMTSQTTANIPKQTCPNPRPASSVRAPSYQYPNAAGYILHEPQSPYRPVEGSPSTKGGKPAGNREHEHADTSPPTTPTTPTQTDYSTKRNPLRRRPSLACFFCRERKIACGRPAEGSPDQTCNQCARRSFTCEYPTESLRGQHRRGRKKVHAYSVERAG